MTAARVQIYTRQFCGYCTAAVRLLEREEIPFEHIDLSGDSTAISALKQRTGHPTVPQILLDGALLGGYTELRSWIAREGSQSLR